MLPEQLAEIARTTRYRVTVLERECPADDFDTEHGGGIPDDVEATEGETVEATGVTAFEKALEDLGLGQWDGGSTAYDPDGTHLSPRGVVSERFGRVEVAEIVHIPSRDKYGDGGRTSPDVRVPGLLYGRTHTVTIGGVDETGSAVQRYGGEKVQGPWMWTHANTHCTVIDNYGGSARTTAEAPLELAFDQPFTFEGVPGLYCLRRPGTGDGDHARIEELDA